ncbi:electron transfer flavoprotein subunit alpha [Hyphomonas adhaerens MHS-3]|uniref:Electron transfer flavoprotein subunit alpha n=1 Tax=Hyphomonas adhaerens MHS-3 TaxID=1280949 RepID=A0A069E6V1_9PROT|nr:electron transfer flavoprotein subunit alpha/FixB family protein [Hyphomonas adhaerens]KCZ86025.1 electron transfer flavoprotein subunit alpha [Hyphomonas adhaerens MHS-3]
MSRATPILLAVCLPGATDALAASLAFAKAQELELWALACGPEAGELAEHAVEMGVSRAFAVTENVSAASDPEQLASLCSQCLHQVCDTSGGNSYICVFSADPSGDVIAAMVSVDLAFECAGRVLTLERDESGFWLGRGAYGGRLQLETQLGGGSCTCVVQSPKGDHPALGPSTARVETIDVSLPEVEPLTVTTVPVDEEGFDLHSAKLVLSGGRGLNEQGFAYLAQLAHALDHAAVGASLPAVDLGLAPVSWQVGQSGKFVSPDVYFAIGISGTPQHLAGVSKESRIIAINSDPDATIFSVAEIGVIADWKEVLPRLVTAVSQEVPQ